MAFDRKTWGVLMLKNKVSNPHQRDSHSIQYLKIPLGFSRENVLE